MQIGQRVKIMQEFIGRKGTVVDNSERDYRTVMNRVRLDRPVMVNGSLVYDDLWSERVPGGGEKLLQRIK